MVGICGRDLWSGICGQGFVVRDLWSDEGFVVRRDWNFARSGKPAAIFQKLYRSEDPAKDHHRPKGNVSSPSTRSELSFS